ncbi:hypothetical protein ACIA8C_00420 [Nocardia sp. NPDC051321]
MVALTCGDPRLRVAATAAGFRQVPPRFRVTWHTQPVRQAPRTEP